MVAKLSSARIILAAPLATSVPVMPIAMPMSAAAMAGASFTPSPVIATTLPLRFSTSTSLTLCSGATRAITPIPSTDASASASLIAANSAPVTARPSMPSSSAIAAAVTAWSPVIIRTRMPARFASAIAATASARGGSTSPIERRHLQVLHQRHQVARGVERRRVELALGESQHPPALAGDALVLGKHLRPHLVGERIAASAGHPHGRRPAQQDVGRAFHIRADHGRAVGARHAMERRHELVVGVERHRRDARVGSGGTPGHPRRPSRRARRARPPSGRR